MNKMIVLFAGEGKVLTDGKVYGTSFYFNEGESTEHIQEMTLEEFKASKPTEEDYLDALGRLGVK